MARKVLILENGVERLLTLQAGEQIADPSIVLHDEDVNGPMPQLKIDDQAARDLTKSRDDKLDKLRRLRGPKLLDLDLMVNELSLGVRVDTVAVKDYRQALLDVTNNYKNHASDPAHATAVDALDPDAYSWPVKP